MIRTFLTAGPARLLFLALAFVPPVISQAAEPPKWLRQVADQPAASAAPDEPATVLLDETVLTIDERSQATWKHRYAVRILTRAGLTEARGSVAYLDKKDTVTAANAWLLRGEKVARAASNDKWFDWSAAAAGAIFDETRAKEISFRDEAVPGDVFGSDTTVEGPMLFAQEIFAWDNRLPTVMARCVVKVPPGWSVSPVLRGAAPPVAAVSPDNRTWTWELRDRPYRPFEPWTDPHSTMEAILMVNFSPASGAKTEAPRVFRTWAEVADWQEKLSARQCDNDPALSAKARQLVAACTNETEKIRALASYVQQLRYVAINRNLARGMGYQPRKATDVFAKGFGDCKDKSNLLRAMLREAGITSYPVAALSSNEREIEPSWPSPYQFNHQILAIQVGGQADLPTVVPTRQWGSLLFFDSTDPETLVGDLPWYLQGSRVLVLAPGSDELVILPSLAVERRWLAQRRVQLALAPDGVVAGECHLTGFAQSGAQMRRSAHSLTAKELHDWATGRLNTSIRGASAQNVACEDDPVSGRFGVNFRFSAPGFVQMMPGGLSIVRLDVLDHGTIPAFAENARRTPVELQPLIQDDEVTLALPAGLVVDELPAGTALSGKYGSYESTYQAKEGTMVFHRMLKLSPQVVPAADYAALRQFLSKTSKADREAVVLRSAK